MAESFNEQMRRVWLETPLTKEIDEEDENNGE